MRTRDAFLIVRFLTWPPAILGIVILVLVGVIGNSLGLFEPRHPTDIVCIGAKSYDLNDESDRHEIIDDLSQWNTNPSAVLQRPPCDMLGSPISQESMDKLFGRQGDKTVPAKKPNPR